jgi:hypothetical protein
MKTTVLIILSFLLFEVSFSQEEQTLKKVTIAPPTAAGLIKYADFPVSYHTGIPQVSLPLYTISEGSLTIPISLSYHAGGIKLDEQASWVGLGWSLNAGGVITRTVVGTPDENGTAESAKNTHSHLSNSGYNNFLFQYDVGSPLSTTDVAYLNDISNGIRDGEPDLFFFNFNGYSGKFYFNDDGRALVVPEADFKIDYTFTSGQYSIQKFIITTPDGTKYYFGVTDSTGDVDPVEKTHNYYTGENNQFYTGTNNTIASWYLNKIISADNQFSITLNYASESYSYKSVQGKPYKYDNYVGSTNHAKYYGHWVQGVRLASIASSNVTVYFDAGSSREDVSDYQSAASMNDAANTSAKTLGAIRIVNNVSDCKKFSFTYSYFTSNTDGLPSSGTSGTCTVDLKRLKLQSFKEEKCVGSLSVNPYVFEYFSEAIPRRLSFAKDHWGYINGKTTNDRLIPTFYEKLGSAPVYKEISGADRDAAWPAMRAGSLKKINYPTGGFTEFVFEANTTRVNYQKYSKTLSFTMSAGFNGSSNPVVENHSFNSAGYTVKLTNYQNGESAAFDGVSGLYVTANPGNTSYSQSYVSAGTYQVSLQKLNPTSGYGVVAEVFEWTASTVSENSIVGGMRIDTIKHSDGIGPSPVIVTNYDYDLSNGQSTGRLYSRPTYVQIVRNDFLRDAGIYTTNQNAQAYCSAYGYEVCSGDAYTISPNSLRPMETTQGNHIGYNEIKVSQTGNGYKVYRYYGSNIWDNNYSDVANRIVELQLTQSNSLPSFPSAPPQTDFMRGELKYEGVYNQGNQLLTESTYYPEYTENSLKTPAVTVASGAVLSGLPVYYNYVTSKKTKLSVQTTTYQPGVGYLEASTENFFGSTQHTQLSKKIETNSKGETIETNVKYAADFKPSACLSISDGLSTFTSECSSCQSQYITDRNTSGHNTAYWKYWDYQKWLKCQSEARKTFFAARKDYFNPAVNGSFAKCLADAKNNASTELKPLFELQDRFMVDPIESYVKNGSNLLGATWTKYVYGTAPTDMVYANTIQKINLTAPSGSFTNSVISSNSIVKDSRYADEVSILVSNGNVKEATGKDGVVTSYIWGYSNTLPIVKGINVNYSTLLSAYNAVSGNLGTIRSQSSLANALITTYEYRPGVGMTKETDPRGRSIIYEYDALNRLSIVKDHDNNVIKKICYNYTGQTENCGTSSSSGDITLTSTNDSGVSGLIALYTNTATSQQYSFTISQSTSPVTLGAVPAGTYNITISKSGNTTYLACSAYNNSCSGSWQYGTSATFYNITVSSSAPCNGIQVTIAE